MKPIFTAALFGAMTIVATGFSATSADAKISCKGPYQLVSGVGAIATPYCEDNYLAKIARGYGMKVSNKGVRNNPSTKERVCNFIGHDQRVDDICAPYNKDRRGRF